MAKRSSFISLSNIAANPFSLLIIGLLLLLFFVDVSRFRLVYTVNLLFFAIVLLLWMFVDISLKSPKFFYLVLPGIYLLAAANFVIFVEKYKLQKLFYLFLILLFSVFLVNLFYLGLGSMQQNFEILKNPIPSLDEAAGMELPELQQVAGKIQLNADEQILFLSRAETTGAVVFFLDNSKYIWEYLWYDSEDAIRLHLAKSREEVFLFLAENDVKYVVAAKERLTGETSAYIDNEHPQMLPLLIGAEDKSFKKIAETTQLIKGSKVGKNVVVYEVVYS